jgi:hypothetical protein
VSHAGRVEPSRSRVDAVVPARMNLNDWMPKRSGAGMVGLVAVSGLALSIAAFVGVDPNALCLLPALALAVPLLMRRYPGERILTGTPAARGTRTPRPRASAPRLDRVFTVIARGGELIGRSLAVRPPPGLCSAS